MKKTMISLLTQLTLVAVSLWGEAAASAQDAPFRQSAINPVKTNSKMIYHGGPVLLQIQDVYIIFYGSWTAASDATTMLILSDFLSTIGNTPYMQINSDYTDSTGNPASAALVYGGSVIDSSYSHGVELTDSDIQGIIYDQIVNFRLPQDPQGIYIIVASADISSTATDFCTPGAPPYHSNAIIFGARTQYVFLGNPNRCPTIAGAQFAGEPTPNGDFAGDAMVTNLAHALNGILTDPLRNAWYDRYGLENADKCTGTFGQTYTTANGARANIHLGSRDYLLEQNWINDRKGRCALYR